MADRINQQLGNYRIIRPIGRGGFAEVYLGEHIYLKTQVAIKILQIRVSNEDDMKDFLQEAQTIAHLIHPNIVRVTDFGMDGETPYLVMDYAPNGTLRQRHAKGTILPLPTIVTYVKQIAAGLQYAHEQRYIHRDIKPENMLVGRNNEILLSDFGIALVAQSSRYQSTQEVVGTVAYMSPEQIQGKPRPSSDQYSLAIVTYEWLTGDRPFHGSFTELCTQHMFASPPPLREKVPSISPLVEQVVAKVLAKDPKQRFGSMQAFANALEQASRYQQPTVPIPPPPHISSPLPPTQAAMIPRPAPVQSPVTPPLPPTRAADIISPSRQDVRDNDNNNRPVRVRAATKSSIGKSIPGSADKSLWYKAGNALGRAFRLASSKESWSISKRQKWATVAGTIGYAILLQFRFTGSDPFSNQFVIIPALVISIFLGTYWGPWVGLITGGLGSTFFYFYYVATSVPSISWQFILGYALVGFIAGHAILATRGRYNTARNILIADLHGAAGIFIGVGLAEMLINPNNLKPAFISIILSNILVGLIFLPVLLIFKYSIDRLLKRV